MVERLSKNLRGALWKVTACVCFAGINGIVRHLSTSDSAPAIPSYEIAFFQNIFGLAFMLPWLIRNGSTSLRTKRPVLQIVRVLTSAVGVVLWYISLSYMPIAQAVALGFLGPLITTLGARFALKESLGPERSFAIAFGFVGGFLISHARYLTGELPWHEVTLFAILPLSSAFAFSVSSLMAKRLSDFDSPELIVSYLLLMMAPILAIPTFLYWTSPTLAQWFWLVAMGGFAASAHLALTKAFAAADMTFLIPFGFTRLLASSLIGLVVFAEVPTYWTIVGSLIVMAAITSLGHLEGRRKWKLIYQSTIK